MSDARLISRLLLVLLALNFCNMINAQGSSKRIPFQGSFSGNYTFSGGSSGKVDISFDAEGRVEMHFDNNAAQYTYDVEGTVDSKGKFTGTVIFNGKDWGSHQGLISKGPGGKLVARIEETPRGKPPTGFYQIDAKSVPEGSLKKKPIVYQVTMTTTMTIPEGRSGVDQVRAYHALPTFRPWSPPGNSYGAQDLGFTPKSAELIHHSPTQSDHLLWTITGKQEPGAKLTFMSRMLITSVDRKLDAIAVRATWKDYEKPVEDKTAVVDPELAKAIHPELARRAVEFKRDHAPAKAVCAMCQWIVDNIKYDASVRHSTPDVDSILLKKCGHCGHQATVLRHLTAAAGIPIRTAWGMNLYAPDGRTSDLQSVRADYTNIHTWAEIYIPGAGWVEVDPNLGSRAFALPSHLIQCNRWFQNYSIWLRDEGIDKQPAWRPVEGGFRSEFGVEHIISYTKQN